MPTQVEIREGDSAAIIKTLTADSVDSCVTDPPYALTSIVKRFGVKNAAPAKHGKDGAFARASKGFMGKTWDNGSVAFTVEFWAEVFRVLKPGGHVVAFGGTRTYHRLVCAIEDAGFEIRDQIGWMYATGFPKSHDVSKHIDKKKGHKRPRFKTTARGKGNIVLDDSYIADEAISDQPVSRAALKWKGWGTALKPAWEPICVARKPFAKSVAENVLEHGTGAINIDRSRIPFADEDDKAAAAAAAQRLSTDAPGQVMKNLGKTGFNNPRASLAPYLAGMDKGRWPANVMHDGSPEVIAAFAGTNGAQRFFYSAKADSDDRCRSKHPTVKPVDLMAYLVRLVTPPGGIVLDPFAGSGSTGMAALRAGFNAILIEREAEYVADIKHRLAHVSGKDTPLFEGGDK